MGRDKVVGQKDVPLLMRPQGLRLRARAPLATPLQANDLFNRGQLSSRLLSSQSFFFFPF